MPFSTLSRRFGALAALLFITSLLSCGREVTGPDGARWSGSLALAPHFEGVEPFLGADVDNVAALVPFTKVRVIVQRAGATVASRVVPFGPTADSVALGLSVSLTSKDGDSLQVLLRYINAAGDTVFRGGPFTVLIRPGTAANASAVEMPVAYVGPGSQAVTVDVTPDSVLAISGQSVPLTTVALDQSQSVVNNAVVGFISRDPTRVVIPSIGVGSANVVGARGSTYVIAQLVGGAMDSTKIVIDPRPTTLIIESGNGQSTLQGTAFSQPLRVRVRASDNLGVANWPVNFAVTAGNGSVDSLVAHTDSLGYAQVIWTAGATGAAGSVTASIAAPALNVVFNGTQLSTAPTSITYATQPNSITAGNPIDTVRVQVRNGAGTIITSFNGPVTVALVNGTAGAVLSGTLSVNAVNGVATFGDLTVDRQGNNYRLTMATAGVSATFSNPFNVAPAPPAQRTLFAGGGQSGAASTALADSIVVRVTDQFGFPVAGVTVNFAVTQGGGGVSPASGVTGSGGFVATQWTLGASGPQQITATAGALSPLAINATLIGGGPAVFFAGNDYTYIPAGQTRSLPIFLSAPSASPVPVALSTQYDSIATVATDTVIFTPGLTRLDVPVTAGTPGQSWVYFRSSLGDDSVFVYVDSASVAFAELDWNSFAYGDTVRTFVILSDPAPAGGLTVTVVSLDSTLVLVAPSDGEGVPIPACLDPYYCGGVDVRAETPASAPRHASNLIGPLNDTASVFIPAGQRIGYVVGVVIATNIDGFVNANFTVSAPGHIGNSSSIYISDQPFSVQAATGTLSSPIGVGQRHRILLYAPNGSVSTEHRFTLTSADTAIATVDSSAVIERLEYFTPEIAVHGRAIGSTFIRYATKGAVIDSFEVFVGAPELDAVPGSGFTMGEGESGYLYTSSMGPGKVYAFPRSAPLNYTVTSTDTSVLRVITQDATIAAGQQESSVLFRVVGPGTASLVAQADAHVPDTVTISTVQDPLQFYSGALQVGVGQYDEAFIRVAGGFHLFGETLEATVTSLGSGVINVLTPTIHVGLESSIFSVVYAGLAAGTDTLRVSMPGHPDLDLEISVLSPEVALSASVLTLDPDSTEFTASVFIGDGSFAHPQMDTVVAILRSSDPTVVQVTDSILVVAAGAEGATGKYRALQPGSAVLTVDAGGISSLDSLYMTVVPYQLSSSSSSGYIGLRTSEYAVVARNSPTSAILDYSITQSGPGAVSFTALPDSFAVGASALNFNIVGVTPGEDTIVFSAAGHGSTTMIVVVDSIQLSLDDIYTEVGGGFRDPFVYGYLRLGESPLPRRAAEQMKFVVTSLDTTLAKVEQDTVIFEPGDVYPTQFAQVHYRDFGTVSIVVTDPLGIFPPDTTSVDISPRELSGYTSTMENHFVLGMGQKADDWEVSVERYNASSDSLWVHLKASADGIISMPDSVLILPGYENAEIPIIAGDTVGAVRVEASVPGYNPWVFDVTVTRTVAEPWFDNTYVGGQTFAEVYFIDALTGYSRPMATPVPMRFTTPMPSLLNVAIGNFLADTSSYYTYVKGPIGVAVGRTTATVEDARVASFDQIASGSADIEVYQPTLDLLRELFQVGVGLKSLSTGFAVNVDAARDSIWVRFATTTGRAKADPDSILLVRGFNDPESWMPASTFNQDFALIGDSLGVDTLVVSADGFASEYGIISVEQGALVLSNTPAPTIVVGDSTLVTLALRDPGGGVAVSDAVIPINLSAGPTFAISDGASTVSTINIPAGAGTVSFWVRAASTGEGELVITSPNFRTFRLRFTTRSIPGSSE